MSPSPRSLRQARALSLCTVVAGVLVFLTGSPAAAHASLLSTDPAEGSVVRQVPDEVVLTFNEPIRLDSDGVHAFTSTGDDWAVEAHAEDNRLVVTPSADPGRGTVVVAWKVISEDGHIVGGALTFSVGAPSSGSAAPSGTGSRDTPTSVTVARWVATSVTVAALLGLLVLTAVVVLGVGLPARWTHHGLLRALDLLWNAAFVGAVLVVPLEQLTDDGRGLSGLVDWLTWIDGLTVGRSLLLLGAVLVAALLVRIARRIARPVVRPHTGAVRIASVGLAAVSVAAAVTFVLTSPDGTTAPAAAVPSQRSTATSEHRADLGSEGTAVLTVHQAASEAVRLDLRLETPAGQPLKPFAPPTLSVANDDIDLGAARLERLGAGRYRTSVTIPRDGQWSAQVSVRTSEFGNPVANIPFTIG